MDNRIDVLETDFNKILPFLIQASYRQPFSRRFLERSLIRLLPIDAEVAPISRLSSEERRALLAMTCSLPLRLPRVLAL
jgi:hypothetical protein